jgi:hypothetical protein
MQGVLKTEPRRSLQTKRNSDGFAIHDASERLLSYYLSFGSQNISLTETYIIGQSEHLIKGFDTKPANSPGRAICAWQRQIPSLDNGEQATAT